MYRMEFPDDPTYDDEWEDAQRFVEACGQDGALKAAFLQTAASNHSDSDDDELMGSAESILFEEEAENDFRFVHASPGKGAAGFGFNTISSRSNSTESEVAAKAAALVRLHRKIAAAA